VASSACRGGDGDNAGVEPGLQAVELFISSREDKPPTVAVSATPLLPQYVRRPDARMSGACKIPRLTTLHRRFIIDASKLHEASLTLHRRFIIDASKLHLAS